MSSGAFLRFKEFVGLLEDSSEDRLARTIILLKLKDLILVHQMENLTKWLLWPLYKLLMNVQKMF